VVLDKDFVKYAVEAIEKDNNIGAVQGKLYKQDKILDTTGLLAYKNRRFVNRGQGEEDKNQYAAGEIFGVDGAAPLYRRAILEDVKINNEYFDEDFFMFKEDVDLAWRMRLFGRKAVYEPRAYGYHSRGAGEAAVKDFSAIIQQRKKLSQFAKFYSFKNQRLMQIKNELWGLFFRHFYYIVIKEIAAWIYVLFFENYGLKAILSLFKQMPQAWQKRKIIMKKASPRLVGLGPKMKKWFV
jgi:GT2 family glycosyltransferase